MSSPVVGFHLQVFKRFVELGRIAHVGYGPHADKLVVIVNVVDQNRALVDGPCSGVKRQSMPFKILHLTDFVIKIPYGCQQKAVREAWEKADITKRWQASRWYRKIEARKRKANMNDFDRYKLMKVKRMRNRIIKAELRRLQKAETKAKLSKKEKDSTKKLEKSKSSAGVKKAAKKVVKVKS
uniref:Large ribosomal subunit protein eL14 n=1 Tax=Eptatretus burgeri TaxID=7764 RepID=A0A8C4QCD4_EPTBU